MNYNMSKQDAFSIVKKAYGYYKLSNCASEYIKIKNMSVAQILEDEYVQKFISKSLDVVEGYINSTDTLSVYQKRLDYRIEHLTKYIEVVRLAYPDIYCLFLKKKNYEELLVKVSVNRTKDELLELVINGIEEKEEIREFDIIDYYMIANIPPRDYLDELKKEEKENFPYIKSLSRCLGKFAEAKEFNEKQTKEFINNAYMLRGQSLTEENKLEIVRFLDSNNIPLNMMSKTAAAHRLINGTLYENEEVKIKRA